MPFDVNKNQLSFGYNLLINAKYRIWRHVFVIIALAAISADQMFSLFMEDLPELGNKIYLFIACVLLNYLSVIYFNLYVLIPKYMLKKKYATYFTSILLLIGYLILFDFGFEYFAHKLLELKFNNDSTFSSDGNLFLETLSSFIINTSSIMGISVTVLLKHWSIESQRVSQLEREHIQSEVEQLKEQINPIFLFNILNRTGNLAKTDSQMASVMLMKLSAILRYQLYDCARDKVLLNSEISFLQNYLELQQLYYDNFKFSIKTKGDLNRIFLPSLLFLPFVQSIINVNSKQESYYCVSLRFEADHNNLTFYCSCENDKYSLHNTDLAGIKKRLYLLFHNTYKLELKQSNRDKVIKLQLNLEYVG